MDYNPVNISPDSDANGDYFQTKLGCCDYWAIEYAYGFPSEGQSEKQYLESVARGVSEPMSTYKIDEDASSSSRGIDPLCTRYDIVQRRYSKLQRAN